MATNVLVLPTSRDRIVDDSGYLTQIWRLFLERLLLRANSLKDYTVATLPDGSTIGAMIFVTDETGGAVPAFWDGAAWRRMTDRAIVS